MQQSAAAHPDLMRGSAPVGLLSAAEQHCLAALRTPKRRHDWLLGRWTAKHLLQAFVGQMNGQRCPLDSFSILSAACGAPIVTGPHLAGVLLSISHRDEHAFCALLAEPPEAFSGGGLGADIERVEPRSAAFVEDYMTADERLQVRRAPAGVRDLLVTAIWSGKEAALKALRLGLTVDTRAVSISLDCPPSGAQAWMPFGLSWNGELGAPANRLGGWWRTESGYVCTLVVPAAACASPGDIQALSPIS